VARGPDTSIAPGRPLVVVTRRNPLDRVREPTMGRLAAVPLGALGVFVLVAWLGHERVEKARMEAVAEAVTASGHVGSVEVTPMRGEECWRAREGFAWKTADASGWACAGPGGEVRLQPGRR
jgi:hypothetical protein